MKPDQPGLLPRHSGRPRGAGEPFRLGPEVNLAGLYFESLEGIGNPALSRP